MTTVKRTNNRRYLANYERVLTREELGKRMTIQNEFMNWVKADLSRIEGYSNIIVVGFEETDRILDADVVFDYEGDRDLFAANQPRFDSWTVVSLRLTKSYS